jgi:hypothetical protein
MLIKLYNEIGETILELHNYTDWFVNIVY